MVYLHIYIKQVGLGFWTWGFHFKHCALYYPDVYSEIRYCYISHFNYLVIIFWRGWGGDRYVTRVMDRHSCISSQVTGFTQLRSITFRNFKGLSNRKLLFYFCNKKRCCLSASSQRQAGYSWVTTAGLE